MHKVPKKSTKVDENKIKVSKEDFNKVLINKVGKDFNNSRKTNNINVEIYKVMKGHQEMHNKINLTDKNLKEQEPQ